ncbi:hypothetical protein PP175_29140 (plasmid) [Aneurinibacillus sp. Ricciae_BoGa-3]|uniref:hypothetical protein n=1 Tax=Aneurinibacillus sp. Ricciae_BoGa-3 TaxID=3022697 RepID=UPI002341F4A7|nr:hypothetical protein [Aneurinibacillus sp. Ricciae_BoGa-3]WCK57258.1 hypothetical protein PP175_29140 [Aneurinibacillus sp. Ricciae_BoGa-3]
MNKKVISLFFVIVVVGVLLFGLEMWFTSYYKHQIQQKVSSEHGTIVSIQQSNWLQDPFPLWEHGKGAYIFKFVYQAGNHQYTGWALCTLLHTTWELPTDKKQ